MHYTLTSADHWREIMRLQLDTGGKSIYAFSREAAALDICSQHTAACLLARDGTARAGTRVPSLANAIRLADLAGCDLVIVPRKRRARRA